MKRRTIVLAAFVIGLLSWALISPMAQAMVFASLAKASMRESQIVSIAPTGSMLPTLSARDIAIVQRRSIQTVAVGDIIMFRFPTQWQKLIDDYDVCMHRVIGKTEDGKLLTQGDNCASPDPWTIDESLFKGVLVASARY